jgi:hydroxymethylpyrimidine/phosphomethylpyrimidine kinase
VMVSSSGDRLLEPAAERLYVQALLPHAFVITPNIREAEVLLGISIRSLSDQRDAARALGELGGLAVVVKGGHAVRGTQTEAIDVVWDRTDLYELRTPRVDTANNHGTGCTFASATAALLAGGATLTEALAGAKGFITKAVAGGTGWRLGRGHGPVDHFGWGS